MDGTEAERFMGEVMTLVRLRDSLQATNRATGATGTMGATGGQEETPMSTGSNVGRQEGHPAADQTNGRHLDVIERLLAELAASRGMARRPKIADPAYFDGDRKDYRRFKTVMKYKLSEDRGGVGNVPGYIMSRLTGKAATFWELLDLNFLDRLAGEIARNHLLTMRQGSRKLQDFNINFNNCAMEAGEANEMTLKNIYRLALSTELRTLLVTVDIDQDWSMKQLQEKVSRIEENLYRSKARRPDWTTKEKGADEMDWEPTKASAGRAQASQSKGRRKPPGPERLPRPSGTQRRAKWVSLEELKRRKEQRLCFRCG
ncbi:hypothetical protein PSPO01_16588 [Paraphaeosphaeria sporulosa]